MRGEVRNKEAYIDKGFQTLHLLFAVFLTGNEIFVLFDDLIKLLSAFDDIDIPFR